MLKNFQISNDCKNKKLTTKKRLILWGENKNRSELLALIKVNS